jgi:hypothetical protein
LIRRRERGAATTDWREVLAPVAPGRSHEEQLDGLLEATRRASGLPAAHLYLADATGGLLLERASAAPGTAAPPETLERSRDDHPHLATTGAGRWWCVPIDAGAVIAGPIGDTAPSAAVDALASLQWPLSFAVSVAREREQLRRRAGGSTEAARHLHSSALEIDRLLHLLLDLARSATGAAGGFVAVVDDSGVLTVRGSTGIDRDTLARLDLTPGTGMFDWAPAEYGGALVLRDIEAAVALGWSSVLAVPVQDDKSALGLLALVGRDSATAFGIEGLELLSAYADQARLMLGNARLFSSFVDEYLATVQGLARSLDLRRPHTRDRHAIVADVAARIAAGLDLAPDVVEAVRLAGTVHDVGMAALQRDDIAAGDLDHPIVSAALVEHLPLHPEVGATIRSHHEWYDGWGFPDGLRGDAIPIGGRVLAVAVVMAELAAGDPAKAPCGDDEIAASLRSRRGDQLDPAVVDVAVQLLPSLSLRAGVD